MSYEINCTTNKEHIDFQGIMDGLYYPFYLEDCRHKYINEMLRFDMKANAENGINIVLSQYIIKFIRSLGKDDSFIVNCSAHPDKNGKPQFHFKQEIRREGKLVTVALFTATCVPASGGKAFVPDSIREIIKDYPSMEALEIPKF